MARKPDSRLMSQIQNSQSIILNSIGIFRSDQIENYQAGRQPDEFGSNGFIDLHAGNNFEQALQDLEGCTHLWLIFGFHRNTNWKPMVQTPRSSDKVGVFATRAPYRPNPIGLSLVTLISVKGLTVEIGPSDLLDGSPIYDIKPYHPENDFVKESKIDWLDQAEELKYEIKISPLAQAQFDWLQDKGEVHISSFAIRQLAYDPTNDKKKRIHFENGIYTLAYRTWRIQFAITEKVVAVLSVNSGYKNEEISNTNLEDPYSDKDLHRRFVAEFN